MKYFPLIWAGLWRKKARTTFTMLSIVVAFLLPVATALRTVLVARACFVEPTIAGMQRRAWFVM